MMQNQFYIKLQKHKHDKSFSKNCFHQHRISLKNSILQPAIGDMTPLDTQDDTSSLEEDLTCEIMNDDCRTSSTTICSLKIANPKIESLSHDARIIYKSRTTKKLSRLLGKGIENHHQECSNPKSKSVSDLGKQNPNEKPLRTNIRATSKYTTILQKQNLVNLPKKDHPMRHLIFNPQISLEIFKKHIQYLSLDMRYTMKMIANVSKADLNIERVRINDLPPDKHKTLILDLDETLIHSCENSHTKGISKEKICLKKRPYLKEFLQNLSKKYEIIIFTASMPSYANLLVGGIDPLHTMISCILDRRHCLETINGYFIKDLRIIENRDISNMLIVDNFIHSFAFQLDNGIPILEWKGDPFDQELKYLEKYLNELYEEKNIQQANKERLRLREIYQYSFDELFL